MRRLRISAISYLNTAPLMWDFEHGESGRSFDISYTLPSGCARALADGSADIGIIPAAAYTQIPGLQILPEIAIASRRAVRSILLVSEKPIEEARSVALDTSSMTSVALTKVLFEKWLGGGRTFLPMQPEIKSMLAQCDAGLLIGDPALQIDRTRYYTLDLAEEWIRFTGKPFVFAFWAVRDELFPHSDTGLNLARIFRESRDHGLSDVNLQKIAREWSPRLRLEEADVRDYLVKNIHYELDSECIAGLLLFYRYASEIGALPTSSGLRFVGTAETTARP